MHARKHLKTNKEHHIHQAIQRQEDLHNDHRYDHQTYQMSVIPPATSTTANQVVQPSIPATSANTPPVKTNSTTQPTATLAMTQPSVAAAKGATGRPSIPTMTGVTLAAFGRRDLDYLRREFPVQIERQDTLSGACYDMMEQLSVADLPMARANFIRMWKTLILKRVQDVYEKETKRRADHFVRIDRSITMPAPLCDLLSSLGRWTSHSRGLIYDVTPPARPAEVPNWWQVDDAIVRQWETLCQRLKINYIMREFPSPSEWENRPIVLTTINDLNRGTADAPDIYRTVKAYTEEPLPTDAYIRFVNDPLFIENHHVTFLECGYTIVERKHITSVVGEYVGGYILHSNS